MNRDFLGRLGLLILFYVVLGTAVASLCALVIGIANSTEANAQQQDNGDPNIQVVHVDVDGRQVTCLIVQTSGSLSCNWETK